MKLHNKALFITGTDTNVGKTFISALLLDFLQDNGIDTGYQKWVSTGGAESEDLLFCMGKTRLKCAGNDVEKQVPYRFLLPASPHLAAEQEGKEVDPALLKERFSAYRQEKELLLIEGVGGLIVPLRRDLCLADFLADLQLPTIIVARSGLGTLNHTLLTIEALRARKIPILGVVFSDEAAGMASDDLLITDNMKTIGAMGSVPIFGRLKRYTAFEDARMPFQPIGRFILSALKKMEGE